MSKKAGILTLAALAPLTAEIMNGSTRLYALSSWRVFAVTLLPYVFLIIVLAYFAQRTASRASALFLLPIAGIVIEGLLVKSFFNTSFPQLSVLRGVGLWGGVQWPWTLSLIASHAFVSFLIPLTLAGLLVREIRISKSAAYISMAVLTLFFLRLTIVMARTFAWYWVKMLILVAIIAVLVYLAQTVRIRSSNAASKPSAFFFIAGLLFPLLNWGTSFFLASKPPLYILISQIFFLSIYLHFLWAQWFNERTPEHKRIIFIAGYYVPYALGLTLIGTLRGALDYWLVGVSLSVGIVVLLMFSIRRAMRL